MLRSCRVFTSQGIIGHWRRSDLFPPGVDVCLYEKSGIFLLQRLEGAQWSLPAGVVLILHMDMQNINARLYGPGRLGGHATVIVRETSFPMFGNDPLLLVCIYCVKLICL